MKNTSIKYIAIITALLFGTLSYGEGSWTLMKSQNGISVYQRHTENSKLLISKVEMTVDQPISKIIDQVTDFDNYKHWNSNCSSSRLIKKVSANEWHYYTTYSAMFITDRELYARVTLKEMPDNTVMLHIQACANIPAESSKNIRITNFSCDYSLYTTSGGKTMIQSISSLDMAGGIPVALINKMSVGSLYNTYANLRRQLADKLLASK